MFRRTLFWMALSAAVLGSECLQTMAAPAPKEKRTAESVARAEKAVKDHLEKLGGAQGVVQYIKDDAVESAFPDYCLFSVLFRQYPIARPTPKGLNSSNLFAVDAQGKVTVLANVKELEKFFQDHLTAVKGEANLRTAVQSWLRLAQQYHQDGFFTFALVDDSIKVAGRMASGTVAAMKGGSGTLHASLTFDEAGKLSKVSEEAKLRRGPRPICQASKLLDNDPLVRRIAEQDLLIMGTAARDYLDEQRAKASPELQCAIDRLWQRILQAER